MTQTAKAAKPITGHLETWGTWERMVPEEIPSDEASQQSLAIHLKRYETVGRFVSGKKVLDIACGTGFGSKMLREAGADLVVGVDISSESVAYAQQHYAVPGIEFQQANAETFESPEPFDVIVTYETIEHLQNPRLFLSQLRKQVRDSGQLFLSVPLGETRHFDPYHLHAFTQEEIFTLLEQAGFELQAYRIEPWKTTIGQSLIAGKEKPETAGTLRQLFFTKRGRRVLLDFLTKGCISWDWLLVHATCRPAGTPIERKALHHLA